MLGKYAHPGQETGGRAIFGRLATRSGICVPIAGDAITTALCDVARQTLQNTTIQFEATTIGTPRQYPAKIENALLRIGQEAVTNSMRHSNASHIRAELQFDPEGLVLRIHDDGCGFDVPDTIAAMNGHYGLVSMQERAEDIEARFSVVS